MSNQPQEGMGKTHGGLPGGCGIPAELCRWGNSSRGETKGEEIGLRACSLSRLQKGHNELGLGRTPNVSVTIQL